MLADLTAAIYEAFASRTNSFAASPTTSAVATPLPPDVDSLPVAYPGAPAGSFITPDSGLWLEVNYLPNRGLTYGLDDDGPHVLRGFWQVNVCSRPGRGIARNLAVASAIVEHFRVGAPVAPARIEQRGSVLSYIDEEEKLWVPVSIPWRCYVRPSPGGPFSIPFLVSAEGGGYEPFITEDGPFEVAP